MNDCEEVNLMEKMFKMVIEMNNKKIISDGEYNLKSVYDTIIEVFNVNGLDKVKSSETKIVALENGNNQDLARFGKVMNFLKNKDWFMDNCISWHFYDGYNDEDEDCLDYFTNIEYYRTLRMKGNAYEAI